MLNEGFLLLEKGAIGELRGFRRIDIPHDVKQRIKDSNTRERINTFSPPQGLTPSEYSALFTSAFLKARADSDAQETPLKLFTTVVQIGNSESLDEIHKIENDSRFSHWENSDFVENFKKVSKTYIG